MRYAYNHDLHIHSQISACSNDPGQTAEAIVEYAKKNNLATVCVTDHFWDNCVEGASGWYAPQDYDRISRILPLPQDEVRFLFGCETELNMHGVLGISKKRFDCFDFVIIPTTHFHMTNFTLSAQQLESPKTRAKAWLDRLNHALDMDLPFHKIGFAHLTTGLIYQGNVEKLLETFDLISDDDMAKVFAKAAKLGAGIELNSGAMKNAALNPTLFRPYVIAKEQGCKFYLGSDAHHPDKFETAPSEFAAGINYLELDESNKFILK